MNTFLKPAEPLPSYQDFSLQEEFIQAAKGQALQTMEINAQMISMYNHIGRMGFLNPTNPVFYSLAGSMLDGYLKYLDNFGMHPQHEFDFTEIDKKIAEKTAKEKNIPIETISPRTINGKPVDAKIEIIDTQAFGTLKHVKILDEDGNEHPKKRPPLLITVPVSGHFDTLLTDTVHRFMQDYDVYISSWTDAKTVPLSKGSFDLNDYIYYLKDKWIPLINMRHQPEWTQKDDTILPMVHTLAVCQPGVPLYSAIALMSEDNNPHTPISLTMMGSPIDTRYNPQKVNQFATEHSMDWFKQNTIATIGAIHKGAGRKVYPGAQQVSGFIAMNQETHNLAFGKMFYGLTYAGWNQTAQKAGMPLLKIGDTNTAQKSAPFYEEYLTVEDMPAEFYLQTVDFVFKQHLLPKGELVYTDPTTGHSRLIDLSAIKNTALLAVEGKTDDITGLFQTYAAHHLSPYIPDSDRGYMVHPVGHYGLFSGSKFRERIAPRIICFTNEIDKKHGYSYDKRSEQIEAEFKASKIGGPIRPQYTADLMLPKVA